MNLPAVGRGASAVGFGPPPAPGEVRAALAAADKLAHQLYAFEPQRTELEGLVARVQAAPTRENLNALRRCVRGVVGAKQAESQRGEERMRQQRANYLAVAAAYAAARLASWTAYYAHGARLQLDAFLTGQRQESRRGTNEHHTRQGLQARVTNLAAAKSALVRQGLPAPHLDELVLEAARAAHAPQQR